MLMPRRASQAKVPVQASARPLVGCGAPKATAVKVLSTVATTSAVAPKRPPSKLDCSIAVVIYW